MINDLIKLLKKITAKYHHSCWANTDKIAEYLINNKVVVLPCNIGDTVYSIGKEYTKCHLDCYYDEIMCDGCEAECDSHCKRVVVSEIVTSLRYDGTTWRVFTNLSPMFAKPIGLYKYGTGVFLNKEDCEAKLKELRNEHIC